MLYITMYHIIIHSRISLAIMDRFYETLLMSSVMRSNMALFLACSENTIAYSLLTDLRTLLMAYSWSCQLRLSLDQSSSTWEESCFICFQRSERSWLRLCSPTFLLQPSFCFYLSVLAERSATFLVSYWIFWDMALFLVSKSVARSAIFFYIYDDLTVVSFFFRLSFYAFAFSCSANFLLITYTFQFRSLFFFQKSALRPQSDLTFSSPFLAVYFQLLSLSQDSFLLVSSILSLVTLSLASTYWFNLVIFDHISAYLALSDQFALLLSSSLSFEALFFSYISWVNLVSLPYNSCYLVFNKSLALCASSILSMEALFLISISWVNLVNLDYSYCSLAFIESFALLASSTLSTDALFLSYIYWVILIILAYNSTSLAFSASFVFLLSSILSPSSFCLESSSFFNVVADLADYQVLLM